MKHKQFILSVALLFLIGACQTQMQEKEITVKEISTEHEKQPQARPHFSPPECTPFLDEEGGGP